MGERMIYQVQLIKLLFAVDDHIFRIGKAEQIRNPWKTVVLLGLLCLVTYSGMGILGIGSSALSSGAVLLTASEYELSKLYFIIGRMIYSTAFVLFVLFIPSLIYYWVTKIPFKKLLLMQVVVLFIMLVERILWIPLAVYAGLDWFVSPFSLGIIASYLTDVTFLIYLCGAVSLFQIWIVIFQIKFLTKLSGIHKAWIWSTVILFHLAVWSVTAVLAFTDLYMIDGWFNE
ncbi:hypothetical protein AB1K81_18315 [Ornithinibacillus sp. 179-J 7C1 HS]